MEPRGWPASGGENFGVGEDEPEGHGPVLLAHEARLVAGIEQFLERVEAWPGDVAYRRR